MTVTYQKPPLTFEEQLNLLKKRGLIINNYDYALRQLSTISYYRLSAYWYPFRQKDGNGNVTDQFVNDTHFEDVLELYEFDRKLRLLVIDAIERIEVYIRTLLTYHLGHTYGAFGHTDPANFHPKFDHNKCLNKLKEEIRRSSETFIKHYKSNYTGFPVLPIWMSTEVISLGSLSVCYQGLKHQDKKSISHKLEMHHKCLEDWLHKLTYIRNVCAHHSRLWNKELSIRPEKSKDQIWNPPVTPRKDRIFYILLMLKYLFKTTDNGDDWKQQCTELIRPFADISKWRIAMGMPEDWENHPVWIL